MVVRTPSHVCLRSVCIQTMDIKENPTEDRQISMWMEDVCMEALDLGVEDDDALRIQQTQAS